MDIKSKHNSGSRDVTIVDYNRGNLFSIAMAVKHVGGNPLITNDPDKIIKADRLILAGVGAFGDAMATLRENNLLEAITGFVNKGNPLLGICLGMQLFFSESYEFGQHKGINLIEGKVVCFKELAGAWNEYKIPHIAWCSIQDCRVEEQSGIHRENSWDNSILQKINSGTDFYFVHSYVCVPKNSGDVLAESEYGSRKFCSVVRHNNIRGCQFHPEKSGVNGLTIYKNFICDID